MGKHTPGPWFVVADERYDPFFCADRIVGYDVKSSTVEVVGSEGISGESEINLANANLIAAAPELLEALECVSQEHDLMRWMKNIEQRRSRGSFGIAVSDDSDAIGWQEQAEKLKVLVLRREAAIARARGEE